MNARSALFDLYGDHLRSRGSRAPVAALVRLLALAGYALTPRAARRLDEAAERIYRRGDPAWDGQWHVLVIERIRDRARRDRVRAALGYLGYAPLGETTWISPRPSVELDSLLERSGCGPNASQPATTATRARCRPGRRTAVFALRSALVHEWRKFLFSDPGFPAALLPSAWPGHEAARVFHAESARLLPGASRFVDCCLR